MNFGEIIEPTSRAFWDDFEDLADGEKMNLEWIWLPEYNIEKFPKNLKIFLVIEGCNISDFVNNTILKNCTKICYLNKGCTSVYYCAKSNFAICISEENDLNLSGPVTQLLIPFISTAERTETISIQSNVLYKGKDPCDQEKYTFIRGINSNHSYAKELEIPNFITGIAAGVSCWRYINNLPISSYLVYIDTPVLDTLSTEPILKLINDIGIKCAHIYSAKIKNKSQLYM